MYMTTKDKKPKKTVESKTLDVKKRTRFTERATIRMDPETKKLLSTFKDKTGITICQLIHALLTAYFYGVGDKLDLDVKSPTINLTIERRVKRVRRYKRDYVDVGESEELYCALRDVYPPPDQLPCSACVTCPNVRCRDYVTKKTMR